MPIFGYRPTPPGDHPFVSVRTQDGGDFDLTVRPGADVADLAGALDEIPGDAVFIESYGDVDAVLVFRPIPDPPPPVSATDSGPSRPPVTLDGGAR